MRDYQSATPTQYQRLLEYQRDDAWIKAFLRRAEIGHIAHLGGGQPFVTPTSFWYDEENHQIIFHSNSTGRLRSNVETNPRVAFVTSEYGRFLPSNAALEVSMQYRSVMVFGSLAIITDDVKKRNVLTAMLAKYFPQMKSGQEYRPITDNELARTSVYAIATEAWSGKENWVEQAEQTDEWPPLPSNMLK